MRESSTTLALLAALLVCVAAPAAARAQVPPRPANTADAQAAVPTPPRVIDGPSSQLVHPSGMGLSVARDGTGGLVYLKQVSGVPHVFASALLGGVFQAPQQIDSGLGGGSSQPVIAAGNGGVLLIGFINAGTLYVAGRASASSRYGNPAPLASGASNPSLEMSNFGKGYLAFTVDDGGGHDVRTAWYYQGAWALESAPLNAVPADDAGTGTGRPEVAAAGDGVAIVVWGEGGHVISRRVWGTAPSVVHEQADGGLEDCVEQSADQPAVAAGGDSSYAEVVFREQLSCGAPQQRVLMNRLHGSVYDGLTGADGLTSPGSDSADDPAVAEGEYGQGFATSEHVGSRQLLATVLGSNGLKEGTTQINTLAAASPPYGVPAIAGLRSDLIAWQQDPGTGPFPEIRMRYSPDGPTLDPEVVLSSPSQGPTDAADGLSAAGDVGGDGVVSWMQGSGSSSEIVAAQLYRPPSPVQPSRSARYSRSSHPTLSWSAQQGTWGPLRYEVSLDGTPVGETGASAIRVGRRLRDGRHRWRVIALNPVGQSSTMTATVFVDTVRPRASLTISGAGQLGSPVRLQVRYHDLPPRGEPPADASGVAKVLIRWGDGTVTRLRPGLHGAAHVYRRARRYRITVLVSDRAGNVTRIRSGVSMTPIRNLRPASAGRAPGRSEASTATSAATRP